VGSRQRFEDLTGKEVRNPHGRVIGRIEEARIEPDGEDYVITHFLVGPAERLARLRAFLGELPTLRGLRIGKKRDLRPFPWDWFDLSDPEHPRLTAEASGA
jgi:sporulation protein YlmC with PRC-barrel domain